MSRVDEHFGFLCPQLKDCPEDKADWRIRVNEKRKPDHKIFKTIRKAEKLIT